MTALANGGWVVTWQSSQPGNYDIYQSVYASDGTLAVDGGTFIANQEVVTAAANDQRISTVAGLAGGGWGGDPGNNQNNGTTDLRQAVYRPDGSLVGGSFCRQRETVRPLRV